MLEDKDANSSPSQNNEFDSRACLPRRAPARLRGGR